jgi:hypothetical protein
MFVQGALQKVVQVVTDISHNGSYYIEADTEGESEAANKKQ